MKLFPAIDLYQKKAVRLYQGDYRQMTVYSEAPVQVAEQFWQSGASCIHLVDLEGAKSGETPNFSVVAEIAAKGKLFTQVGGGIRSCDRIARYLDAGIDRVILGTAAVTDEAFLEQALTQFGEKIAVGVDLKDGKVAIHGWTETTDLTAKAFFDKMQALGVQTVICTDISKDGAMKGTNRELYKQLSEAYKINLIASGGVSSMEDIVALRAMGLYGAIIGKAYYTGAIDLKKALEVAR